MSHTQIDNKNETGKIITILIMHKKFKGIMNTLCCELNKY